MAWTSLRNRCKNKGCTFYERYGGRGIKVHESWLNDFDQFVKDSGIPESADLWFDRINNDGNYEPGNVRWATQEVQRYNKENTTMLEIDGVTKPLGIWAKEYGIKRATLFKRYYSYGWRGKSLLASKEDAHRKTSHNVTINGVTKMISEWARIAGVSTACMSMRVRNGETGDYLLRKSLKSFRAIADTGNVGKVMVRGKEMSLGEVAELAGVSYRTICRRYYTNGLRGEDLL